MLALKSRRKSRVGVWARRYKKESYLFIPESNFVAEDEGPLSLLTATKMQFPAEKMTKAYFIFCFIWSL